MKMRGTLSGLSAGLGRRFVSSTAYAVVAVVALLCLDVLSARAWSRCWGRLPRPGVDVVGVTSDSNARGTSQQAIAAEEYWGNWMEVADSGASGVVKPRQMTEAEKAFALNTPSAHMIASPGIRGMSPHLVSRYTYSISDSDSYTMYLPFVMNGYTHPFLNGDFEIVDGDFARYWEREGDLNVSITSELSNGELCHSGTYCALLGSPDYPCDGVPLGYGRVCQTFGVPSAGVSNLSFYYRIFSYDECKRGRFDCLEAYIDDVLDEAPPILLLREGSEDGNYGCEEDDLDITDWTKSPDFDLSAIPDGNGGILDYRGKTTQLCFYNYSRELPGYPVAWYNTWMYLDDIQVGQY